MSERNSNTPSADRIDRPTPSEPGWRFAWNIKAKIATLAVAAVLSAGLLYGIAHMTGEDLGRASRNGAALGERIALITATRIATGNLILAAMDAIVDKDDGRIAPERLKAIEDAVAFVRGSMDGLVASAEILGAGDRKDHLRPDFETLAAAIQKDLRQAIETKAGAEAFAKLDDAIDGAGDRFAETLRLLDERGQERLKNAFGDMEDAVHSASKATKVVFALTMAFLLPLMFLICRSVVRSIKRLTATMSALAEGDRAAEVPFVSQRDEIGAMARAVGFFKESLIENERLQERQRAAELKAAGDERRRDDEKRAADAKAEETKRAAEQAAEADRKRRMEELADAFEKSVMGVVASVSSATDQMRSSAQRVFDSAERATRQATTVASAAEEATANVQTVASATEQLSASIEEISRQVTHSNRIA